ncbi:MAG: threonine--tRNA ligase [Parcubacteria group bacterium]|jgi:threonyl-tRNA synthetase
MQKQPKIEILRHSLSHVLAAAVFEMFPDAQFGIGPNIENGFYYDFDLPRTLIPEDLAILEEKMRLIISKNFKFEKGNVSIDDAVKKFKKLKQPYKIELIKDIKKGNPKSKTVSAYKTGNFIDLCAGPHIDSTGEISPKAFKLTKISGAYWKGDERNKMLQRIYGVAFATDKELRQYLAMMAEAEKRDHRKIGRDLKLFMISDEVGKGLPLWLPNGAYIRKKLEDYMYELEKQNGYDFVYTPVLAHENLYKKSGHLAHYKDDMYNPIDIEGEKYYLKPMNCPHHHIMFRNELRSYRDLPVRYSDFSPLHRFERSGVLTGLIRARCFSQNDSHIYCSQNQIENELMQVLNLFKKVYKDFGIKGYWFRLSLPDFKNTEKYGDIKNRKLWEKSTEFARTALKKSKEKFIESEGEAAFYGPKIDVQIKNVHGKEDSIATIQVDFYMPERFELEFINEKGKQERPVIIHKAIMGSFDRFFAFLVEQTAGHFPLWLSPVQVEVIPVSEKFEKYAQDIFKKLKENNIRVVMNEASESLGKRIRTAQNQKVNYMLIVGEKEMKAKSVAVRDREKGDLGAMRIEKFLEKVAKEIEDKK